MEKLPVTVIIPVRNEAAGLPVCIERLSRFGEVLVVDSGSTDGTADLARQLGAEVVQFNWNGHYPKKRNWTLLNVKLKYEWVLFLDADELVDDNFCDELGLALAADGFDGYWLNYNNFFVGKPLKHGDAQRKLALFRLGKGLYERIDEDRWSSLDMEVHEHPVINGEVGVIQSRIEHRDDRGIARFIDRHKDYAIWEAERTLLLRRGGDAAWGKLTGRQKFKYENMTKWWFAIFYFIWTYVFKRGFLDGQAGLSYAFYKLWYFWSIRLIILEKEI